MRHSLAWRLPASIAALMAFVFVTFLALAHSRLERTLIDAESARMQRASAELARLLDRREAAGGLEPIVEHAAVASFLARPSDETRAPADAYLRTLLSAEVRRAEIWSATGTLLAAVGEEGAAAGPLRTTAPSPGVGPLINGGDTVLYDAAAAVPGGRGLLAVRMAFTAVNPDAVARLLGHDAVVLMGNRDGTVWSDLMRPVDGPSTTVYREGLFEYDDHGAHVAAASLVPNAPWAAMVARPRATLVAPADAVLTRMIPVALVFLVMGTLLAGAAGARVVAPVVALSRGAAAVSAGNYAWRLPVRGRDELARLAQAFNAMTEEIEASQGVLEARVEERTRELAAARAEADAANRAKSEFLSLMSHDLRTPLNAILGFAQLLESERLTPEQSEHVHHILTGGRHLLALISDVLDITRIESGQLGLTVEPVAVGSLVHDAVELVRPLAAQRRVSLHVNDVFQAVAVDADAQRLNQILLNLLSNAVKYNRPDGTVTVSGRRAAAGRYRITVADTGMGLTDAQRARLFQPFERLGAEQTAVEGTGLGLALSRALAEAMSGTLGVVSIPGTGSTFWIEMPEASAQPASAGAAPREAQHVVPTQGGVVLYVEDNLSNVRLLHRILQKRPGVELLHAATGAEGIALARSRRPELVLLDLHLPDTTGELVLRELEADAVTRHMPKVVVTADATPGLARRLEAQGAAACLTKPLNIADMLRLVDRLLTKGRKTTTGRSD